MQWLVLASLTSFFESLKDVSSKQSLQELDEYLVTGSLVFFAFLTLLPALFVVGIPPLGENFGKALLVGGSINVVANLLYVRALKLSDLSIAVPLITFTPLFLLATAPLIVGERPSLLDAIGVVLIVSGSYVLNLKEKAKGYLAPWKALVEQRGPKLMLGVAFLWSIASTVDKIGVQNSSPVLWPVAMFGYISLVFLPIALFYSRDRLATIPKQAKTLAAVGFCQGIAVFFQMQALNLTLVTHVISVKRMSALWSVLWGHLIFQERGLAERVTGAILMICGVWAIAL